MNRLIKKEGKEETVLYTSSQINRFLPNQSTEVISTRLNLAHLKSNSKDIEMFKKKNEIPFQFKRKAERVVTITSFAINANVLYLGTSNSLVGCFDSRSLEYLNQVYVEPHEESIIDKSIQLKAFKDCLTVFYGNFLFEMDYYPILTMKAFQCDNKVEQVIQLNNDKLIIDGNGQTYLLKGKTEENRFKSLETDFKIGKIDGIIQFQPVEIDFGEQIFVYSSNEFAILRFKQSTKETEVMIKGCFAEMRYDYYVKILRSYIIYVPENPEIPRTKLSIKKLVDIETEETRKTIKLRLYGGNLVFFEVYNDFIICVTDQGYIETFKLNQLPETYLERKHAVCTISPQMFEEALDVSSLIMISVKKQHQKEQYNCLIFGTTSGCFYSLHLDESNNRKCRKCRNRFPGKDSLLRSQIDICYHFLPCEESNPEEEMKMKVVFARMEYNKTKRIKIDK